MNSPVKQHEFSHILRHSFDDDDREDSPSMNDVADLFNRQSKYAAPTQLTGNFVQDDHT